MYVNAAVASRLEYSLEELYRLNAWDLCSTISENTWPQFWDRLIENRQLIREFEYRTKGWEFFPVEIAANLVEFEGSKYVCGIIRDISARKKIEAELYEKEARLHLLLDKMPCMLWTMDIELRFLSVSGAGMTKAGRSPEDIIGKTIFEYSSQFTERSPLVKNYRRALAGEKVTYEQTSVKNKRKFLCHVEPIFDATEKISGLVGVGLDITDYTKATSQIKIKNRRIKELAHAYVEAQEKEREWLMTEIHDRIIQPLSGVSHACEVMVSGNQDQAEIREHNKKALAQVKFAIGEARAIMKELYPATLTRYGLVGLINEELGSYQDETGSNAILHANCTVKIPSDIQTTLYRVFHEALQNIWRHSKAKNVNIELDCRPYEYRLSVADDGIGFDIESLQHRSLPGGIESMTQRTEIIGGKFSIRSSPGKGTTISARIATDEAK